MDELTRVRVIAVTLMTGISKIRYLFGDTSSKSILARYHRPTFELGQTNYYHGI